MELKKKIEWMSRHHIFGVKKLTKVGDAFYLNIPKAWILVNCIEIDGAYYFKLEVEGNQLIFSPISLEDLEGRIVKETK